jgi:hypothetical protein
MRLGPSHDPARGTKTPWDAQAVKAKDQMSALGPTRASASERGNGRYLRKRDMVAGTHGRCRRIADVANVVCRRGLLGGK